MNKTELARYQAQFGGVCQSNQSKRQTNKKAALRSSPSTAYYQLINLLITSQFSEHLHPNTYTHI